MNVIEISHITKDYGQNRGVFDVSFSVKQGEVLGFLGPNGAGKTTTIRQLMGFIKPDKGRLSILDMDCFKESDKIQTSLGYLPGEIAFIDSMTGMEFIRFVAKMKNMRDMGRAQELMKMFDLNASGKLKKMSKGMKQKIGIVAAFMHDPQILLLDEPTSGLDPLMQNRFVELIEKEKKRGKTILLSSHIFEEVEKTCDRIGMIRKGKLVKEFTVDELRHSQLKTYKIEFAVSSDMEKMKEVYPDAVFKEDRRQMIVSINDGQINALIRQLAKCDVHFLKEEKHTLEEYFMQFYGGSQNV